MNIKKQQRWTEDEINIIKEVYPTRGWKVAKALLPDRSQNAIFLKASGLGIKLREGYYRRLWSKEEKEIVRSLWPIASIEEIKTALPCRPYNQIKIQAQKLGVIRKVAKWYRTSGKKLKLKEVEKAYLAGIMDGEGTVMLHIRNSREDYGMFTPEISFCGTDLLVMYGLYELLKFRGLEIAYHEYDRNHQYPNAKKIALVKIGAHASALSFLEALYPYLRIKKEKAGLVISIIRKKLQKQEYLQELKQLAKLQSGSINCLTKTTSVA